MKGYDGWGTYSDRRVMEAGGRYIFTSKFTLTSGLETYVWYKSPNKSNDHEYALWKQKNTRGRKPETKHFLTRDEALSVATKEWRMA